MQKDFTENAKALEEKLKTKKRVYSYRGTLHASVFLFFDDVVTSLILNTESYDFSYKLDAKGKTWLLRSFYHDPSKPSIEEDILFELESGFSWRGFLKGVIDSE